MLLCLIRQTDGVVPQALQKLNQNPDQLAAILERNLNARPRVSGSNVQVSLSRAANDVLEAADREGKSMRDECVSTGHILLELAKSHTPSRQTALGARPLKRTIQRYVQDPLALKILGGEFLEGDTISVEADHEGLYFAREKITA
ncbi:MAG: hypothetical protein HGB05_14610 [Chloroflexi bacterium]|nr:hypothetical protein [Chloroflexota bacterium]